MKKFKKILAITMALVMLAGMSVTASASDTMVCPNCGHSSATLQKTEYNNKVYTHYWWCAYCSYSFRTFST